MTKDDLKWLKMIKTDFIDITYNYLKSLKTTKNTQIENDFKVTQNDSNRVKMMLSDPIWHKHYKITQNDLKYCVVQK